MWWMPNERPWKRREKTVASHNHGSERTDSRRPNRTQQHCFQNETIERLQVVM
jgi:hypothetical protein